MLSLVRNPKRWGLIRNEIVKEPEGTLAPLRPLLFLAMYDWKAAIGQLAKKRKSFNGGVEVEERVCD